MKFEEELAAYLQIPHALGVNSGTDALIIALEAFGIMKGDEVITTPFTFFATVEAILRVGATPVFVDIDETYCLDADKIEEKITKNTRVILPVHLFGQLANMSLVKGIATCHNLLVIEDGAQALGVRRDDPGDAFCTSFYPSKNLAGIGDGGAIAFYNGLFYNRSKMMRDHGQKEKGKHCCLGHNSRLDEIQAVVLRQRLKRIGHYVGRRQEIAALYDKYLIDEIEKPKKIRDHTYNQYVVRLKHREKIREKLNFKTFIYYPQPIYSQEACSIDLDLPETEKACQEVLALPISPDLTDDYVMKVIEELNVTTKKVYKQCGNVK